MPSGWLMNELNPKADFYTSRENSNQFYFGRNSTQGGRDITWAVVNGWPIPVCGTQTGSPPLAANNTEFWNRILLNPPPSGTGANQPDFVFLEAWLQRIDVDPPNSSSPAPGKPARGFVYRFGNTECGFSNLPDELIDPNINYETSKRVQIQYRIRVVSNVGLSNYPEGFDPTLVKAQGALSAPSTVPFSNMRKELGDAGLWRAGTGDPTTFGTADGYVYAIPVCVVFRRNTQSFATTNLAGAFNRNSKATIRANATEYTADITLAADLAFNATSFTVPSISGTIFNTLQAPISGAYFKIDDEIVSIVSITGTAPSINVVITRGEFNTTPRKHVSGSVLTSYTQRPDGLYADQVASSDILDLRHSIANKFDYESILKTNVVEMLKGSLNSTWKSLGAGLSRGSVALYGDAIASSSVDGLNLLDAPDGNRRTWSDAIVTQRFVVPVSVPADGAVVGDDLSVAIDPYNLSVLWSADGTGGGTRTFQPGGATEPLPFWWVGDQLKVVLSNFITGSDPASFVIPNSAYSDSVLIRFEGMTTDPNGGVPNYIPTAEDPTTPSATHPYVTSPVPTASMIMKNGQGLTVERESVTGNLLVTFDGTAGNRVQQFIDAIQDADTANKVKKYKMWLEFTVVYGAGRGTAYKPDWIHTARFTGDVLNNSKTLLRPGLASSAPMYPSYLGYSPLIQTGNNRQYAKTSEVMLDPGSKSIYAAPYTYQILPSLVVRNGAQLNWYYTDPTTVVYQGAMPAKDSNGSSTVHANTDPLNLFHDGVGAKYVEIPLDLLPKPGLHTVPMIPVQTTAYTYFSSGLNFILNSNQGTLPSAGTDDPKFNVSLVAYPSSHPGYYIVTKQGTEIFGAPTPGAPTVSAFGTKITINSVAGTDGKPFKGIKFPPFYGPARITGVYQRITTEYVPSNSPFENDRTLKNPVPSNANVNLLRDDFSGPAFLIDVDTNGDCYFILNAEVLNLPLIAEGAEFDSYDYLVECTLFGFDRGFLQTNGRFLNTISRSVDLNEFVPSDAGVGIISPAPLDADQTVQVFYSRTPYQGNAFGTQGGPVDQPILKGSLSQSEARNIFVNPLAPVSELTNLSNRSGYEVLAALSFSTDLGTGRLSGSNPIPLLSQSQAPGNPVDYPNSRIDLYRRYSLNRVGYQDIADPNVLYPVVEPTLSPSNAPEVKLGALSEVFDNDVHPEFAGCTTRLPLGAYFRDKDFIGKTLYQQRSANGNAAIPVGTLSFTQYEASMTLGVAGVSTWEGTEWVCGNSSNTTGVGSEAIVRVDGADPQSNGPEAFTTPYIFKTARGGAAYSATGPWPGGVITSSFPKSRPNTEVGVVLNATAYLVRSGPEFSNGIEIHPGNELQMLVVTQAAPNYFKDNEIVHSAAGTNEGFSSVDRYRIFGKPLEKRRGQINVDVLPANKPLFVNKIYNDPLFFGSSDLPMISTKQESVTGTDGQTSFTLSSRPSNPTSVQMFLNGVKLNYGTDYTVAGDTNTSVTYYPSLTGYDPVRPVIQAGDRIEFWYVIY
jgi:hypothetical protein